jgi:hypothetical protein
MHLGLNIGLLYSLCAPYSVLCYRSPILLAELQMAPIPSALISSGSKKKEPRYLFLSEVKASLTQNVDWGFLLSAAFPAGGVIT